MPEEYFLQTLGVPRLMTAAGHDIRIRVRKHLAVLVVLAVDGGRIRRDRLVSMFWPYSRPDRARGSLATAVSYLRGKLGGDAIEPGRDFVELVPGLVALDLDRLETGEIIGDDFRPVLEVDGFLRGFELERLVEFESWRDRQHARLLPAIEKALITLTDHSRRSGDINALARYADKLLELNDLSEWGIKARMEAYALSGDRITALRVYDDWVQRLKEELDAAPAQMVEHLAHRLRRRTWDRPASEPAQSTVRTEQWRDRHFIGRGNEYRALYELWEQNRRGEPRHIIITGDSGVGKTTLADRFATGLALEGATVARVRCFELERSIPFAMISGVVQALIDKPGASATNPDSLAVLATVSPDLKRAFPGLPNATDLGGESARIRLAEAALDFLRALTDEQPLLLVIDDYEQSDEASLAVVHVLMRRHRQGRFMVALTARAGTAGTSSASRRFKIDAEELGIESLDVDPLPEEESDCLFEALVTETGAQISPTEKRALIAAAAGFPLALELLVGNWHLHGARSAALAIQAMTRDVAADPEARYQQLTESLFSDFQDSEKVVVHIAAVLDRRVGHLEFYDVAGVGRATALGALSRMVERRAIRDGPGGLEWINPSVRAHAYLSVPTSLRRVLHEAVAAELLRQQGLGVAYPRLEIAWHCMRAGRTREASEFLVLGAMDAMRQGSPHEAELAVSSGLTSVHEDYRDAAQNVLAEALVELGKPKDAAVLLSAATRATPMDLRAELILLKSRFLSQESNASERAVAVSRVVEVLNSGCAVSDAVFALSAGVHWIDPDRKLLVAELLNASERIKKLQLPPGEFVEFVSAQAKLYFALRDVHRAGTLLEEAMHVAEAHRIRGGTYLFVLNGLGTVRGSLGDYPQSLELALRLYNESLRSGALSRASTGAANTAYCLMRLGQYEAAKTWAYRALPPNFLPPFSELTGWETLGYAAGMEGDNSSAHRACEALLAVSMRDVPVSVKQRALAGAADALQLLGEVDGALEVASAIQHRANDQEDIALFGRLARWEGRAATKTGDIKNTTTRIRTMLSAPVDVMDKAEILATLHMLGTATEKERGRLTELLAILPSAAADQLTRLGVLEPAVRPSPGAGSRRRSLSVG